MDTVGPASVSCGDQFDTSHVMSTCLDEGKLPERRAIEISRVFHFPAEILWACRYVARLSVLLYNSERL